MSFFELKRILNISWKTHHEGSYIYTICELHFSSGDPVSCILALKCHDSSINSQLAVVVKNASSPILCTIRKSCIFSQIRNKGSLLVMALEATHVFGTIVGYFELGNNLGTNLTTTPSPLCNGLNYKRCK